MIRVCSGLCAHTFFWGGEGGGGVGGEMTL